MTETRLSPARESFGYLLAQVARGWRREADDALSSYGLSEATALPLMVLSRSGGGLRQGALAERLGIVGPSLVPLINALEADGLVTRREDPTDRRAKTLHLTRKGSAMVVRIDRVLNRVRARLLRNVPERDVEIALRVLREIERQLLRDGATPTKADAELEPTA